MMDQFNHLARLLRLGGASPLGHQFSEETMLNIHNDGSSPGRVTVTFADGALSFMLSEEATLEDRADRLDRLGERHHGKPLAIEVKLAAASAPSDTD
jgi:hypothetical protein